MDIEKYVQEVRGLGADEKLYLVGNGAVVVASNSECLVTYRDGEARWCDLKVVSGPLTQAELLDWLRKSGA
jgi:hypothetical protein